MLKFQLASNDRLHFAAKAIFESEGMYVDGILILTDKRIHFGSVSNDFHIEINLKSIEALSADIPPEEWPVISEKERLTITEKNQYEFTLSESEVWKKKILQRPAAFHLHVAQ